MLRSSSLPSLMGRALAVAGLFLACVAMGWAVANQNALALLAALSLAGIGILAIVSELGVIAVYVFPPLSVVAYPLSSSLPAEPYVTFDRILVAALAILLLRLPAAPPMSRATRAFVVALVAFAVLFGLRAAVTAGHSAEALRTWADALLLPLVVFAVVRRVIARDPEAVNRMALSLVWAGTLLALIGIGQRIFGYELATAAGGAVRFDENIGAVRISGPYGGPEVYALSVVLCLAATMFWTLRRGPSRYTVGYALIALQLVAIALSFFRVGWISAVVVIVLSLALRPNRAGRNVAVVLLSLVVLALSFTGLQQVPEFRSRVQNTENIYGRLATYRQGFEVWAQAPIFGVGVGRYTEEALDLPREFVNGSGSEPYPHSSFENTLADLGVVGFAFLLFLCLRAYQLIRGLKKRVSDRGDVLLVAAATGAALAYVLFSLTLGMLTYGPSNTVLCILLAMVAGRLDSIRAPASKEPREDPAPAAEPPAFRPPERPLAWEPR